MCSGSVFSALEVFFTRMRYINLHLTLTLTQSFGTRKLRLSLLGVKIRQCRPLFYSKFSPKFTNPTAFSIGQPIVLTPDCGVNTSHNTTQLILTEKWPNPNVPPKLVKNCVQCSYSGNILI